jgi:hypothetical protein
MFTTVTIKAHHWTMYGKDLKSHMQKLVSREKERSHVFWATNHHATVCNRLQEHENQKWKIISSQKVRREGISIPDHPVHLVHMIPIFFGYPHQFY